MTERRAGPPRQGDDGPERFIAAQAGTYGNALAELRGGRKTTHWMWFVFPQLRGLGRSATAERYGLADADEARRYLEHPVLGARLLECTAAVNGIEGRSATEIFGRPDDLKFRSSMTLFHRVDEQAPAFAAAIDRYFDGVEDPRTLELLARKGGRAGDGPDPP